MAVSLRYEQGKFVLGATRGDGERGDDITANLQDGPRDPAGARTDGPPALLEVRGEVYMTNSELVRLNELRQADGRAAVRQPPQLDGRLAQAARLQASAASAGSGSSRTAWASREGIDETSYFALTQLIEALGHPGQPAHDVLRLDRRGDRARPAAGNEQRNTLDFQTDGLVIKVDDLGQRERLGSRSKSPRWTIAFKYEAEQAVTKLIGHQRPGRQDRQADAGGRPRARCRWPARPSSGPACTTPTRSPARTSGSATPS